MLSNDLKFAEHSKSDTLRPQYLIPLQVGPTLAYKVDWKVGIFINKEGFGRNIYPYLAAGV